MVEIVEGSERRFDGRVAAIRASDRPWASRARAVGYEFVIGTLAVRVPNRMNRRQVDDVEADRANLRQTPFGFAQCRRLAGAETSRTMRRSARAAGRLSPQTASDMYWLPRAPRHAQRFLPVQVSRRSQWRCPRRRPVSDESARAFSTAP